MKKIAAMSLLFLAVSMRAQSPTSGEREPKGVGREAELWSDETRARKEFDAAHTRLKSRVCKQAIRDFAAGKLPELAITWDQFVTGSGSPFVALQFAPLGINLPGDARVTLFGSVVDLEGRTQTDFEEPARLLASKNDLYLERSIITPLRPGTIIAGVARGSEVLAIGRMAIDPQPPNLNGSSVSRLILTDNIYALPSQQGVFDPFAFGGMKVVPKPDRTFRKGDEPWFFVELRNPALGEDGLPHFTSRVELDGPRKSSSGPSPLDAATMRGVPKHYGAGSTIDTSRLTPGLYRLHVTIQDTVANVSYQRDATLTIAE